MKLRNLTFRILLPVIYLVLALALPIIGAIVTIAEGPNPFGFLLVLSMPGSYAVQLFNRVLSLPRMNIFVVLLFGVVANIGIYFAVGYLIDYAIKRRRRRRSAGHA